MRHNHFYVVGNHSKFRWISLIAALVLIAVAAGCSGNRTATPLETQPPIAAAESTESAAPPPTGTPVATASATPTLTPPGPTPTATPIVGTVDADVLNVREGPGAEYPIVVGVEYGEALTVLGSNEDGTWLKVKTAGGDEGWVSAELVSLPPTPLPTPTRTATPTVTATVSAAAAMSATIPAGPTATPAMAKVNTEVLNVRDGPGAEYPIVVGIENGEVLTVLGANADGTWLNVRTAGGEVGWVSADMVSIAPPPTETPEGPTPTREPPGLGVTRGRVQSFYEELGFNFAPASTIKGQPQALGTRWDGLAVVQLLGKPEDLVSASITVFPAGEEEDVSPDNLQYLAWMATAVAPGWENGTAWVYNHIQMAREETLVEGVWESMLVTLRTPGQLGALELVFTPYQ